MDRRSMVAGAAVLVGALALTVDGFLTLFYAPTGMSFHAARIFVEATGGGGNVVVGQEEVVGSLVGALIGVGLLANRQWGWALGTAMAVFGVIGQSDGSVVDRLVKATSAVVLVCAWLRWRALQRPRSPERPERPRAIDLG